MLRCRNYINLLGEWRGLEDVTAWKMIILLQPCNQDLSLPQYLPWCSHVSAFSIVYPFYLASREPRSTSMTSNVFTRYSWTRHARPSFSKNIRQSSCFTRTRRLIRDRKQWRLRLILAHEHLIPIVRFVVLCVAILLNLGFCVIL